MLYRAPREKNSCNTFWENLFTYIRLLTRFCFSLWQILSDLPVRWSIRLLQVTNTLLQLSQMISICFHFLDLFLKGRLDLVRNAVFYLQYYILHEESMWVIMVITVKSAVLTSLNLSRSDRGIMLIYFAKLPVELVFLTHLSKKRTLGALYSDPTILFVKTLGCHIIHLKQVLLMWGYFFLHGFNFVNVFIVYSRKAVFFFCSFTVNLPILKATLKESFISALATVFTSGLL